MFSVTHPSATTSAACAAHIRADRRRTRFLAARLRRLRNAEYLGALDDTAHASFDLHSDDDPSCGVDRSLAGNDCRHDCYSRILTTITDTLSSAPSSSATEIRASAASRGIRPFTKSIISISWTSL